MAGLSERLRFVGQVHLERRGRGGRVSDEADVDYALLEWSFSDAVKPRVGRTKHAFGIYADILDVGTLRPFYLVPQSIYGAQGITARSTNSVSVVGKVTFQNDWNLSYNVYAGQLDGELETPVFLDTSSPDRLQGFRFDDVEVDEVVGTRLSFTPPSGAINFGLSTYRSFDASSTEVFALHGSTTTSSTTTVSPFRIRTSLQTLATDSLDKRTDLLLLGLQVSF